MPSGSDSAEKTAYFDCFAGAGGDMIVGALLDVGADPQALRDQLCRLPLQGYEIRIEQVMRGGLGGTRFNVVLEQEPQPARHLDDILEMIEHAGLPPRARDRAGKIFARLAEAEARAHRSRLEEVHFHEVGAVDSLLDVVGACVALEWLHVGRVTCSPLPVGRGTIATAHGNLPLPAPATAQLLVGARTVQTDREGELLTPTAAAVLTTLAEAYEGLPAMEVSAVGCGAGSRDPQDVPNLLRVFVGVLDESGSADSVVELSANLDDCTGQVLGATIEKLLEAGCLDAWASPIVMKKSRPAWMLSALCRAADAAQAERILFRETPTMGVRRRLCGRRKLHRRHETVETPYGPIRIKIGSLGGESLTASPEFDDCLSAARAHGVGVREVLAAAAAAHRKEKR